MCCAPTRPAPSPRTKSGSRRFGLYARAGPRTMYWPLRPSQAHRMGVTRSMLPFAGRHGPLPPSVSCRRCARSRRSIRRARRAEASAQDTEGQEVLIVKGAPTAIATIAPLDVAASEELDALSRDGYRTLAVASGPRGQMTLFGLIALYDPPRADSAALLGELRALGVPTIMVTGDTAATALTVGRAIGITGAVCPSGQIPDRVTPEQFAIYAGVFPRRSFAWSRRCSGADTRSACAATAPTMRPRCVRPRWELRSNRDRRRQGGGGPGADHARTRRHRHRDQGGTYRFPARTDLYVSILVNKIVTLLVLGAGLVLTGHAVLTPLLQALSMFTNDFVSMARTADRATPSPHPNAWRVRNLTLATIPLAIVQIFVLSDRTWRPAPSVSASNSRPDTDVDLPHVCLCRPGTGLCAARTRPHVEFPPKSADDAVLRSRTSRSSQR